MTRVQVIIASAINRRVEKFSDQRLNDGDDVWHAREIELRCGVAALANEIARAFMAESPRTFNSEKFAAVCGLHISHGRDTYSDCLPGELTWEMPSDDVRHATRNGEKA